MAENLKSNTIFPKHDAKSFQYALIAALNHNQIKGQPERISKIMAFINQYDWKEIDFPAQQKDWI